MSKHTKEKHASGLLSPEEFTTRVIEKLHRKMEKAVKGANFTAAMPGMTWEGVFSSIENAVKNKMSLFGQEEQGMPTFSLTKYRADALADMYERHVLGQGGVIRNCLVALTHEQPEFMLGNATIYASVPPQDFGETVVRLFNREIEQLPAGAKKALAQQMDMTSQRMDDITSDMRLAREQAKEEGKLPAAKLSGWAEKVKKGDKERSAHGGMMLH